MQRLLHAAATRVRRGFPGAALSPTTLVDEAWAKLASSPCFAASRLHFKRIAARAMRQVLVDAARRGQAHKRGAGDVLLVTLDEAVAQGGSTSDQLLALDVALDELARVQPRQAHMVELRFFGGLDVAETAQLLQVSEATVQRDWRAVKAWLARAIREAT